MAHLGQIQQLLNTDADYHSRFLRDPVSALAEQGLFLSPQMQTQLRLAVAQAGDQPASVLGAAINAHLVGGTGPGPGGGRPIPMFIWF
jgi:hypothetical protein